MKNLTIVLIALASFSCLADCSKNESEGVTQVSQAIADQLIGTAIYDNQFNVRINHTTKSGDNVLSISGIVKHEGKFVSIHGLLACNDETGKYEFAGAGTSGK